MRKLIFKKLQVRPVKFLCNSWSWTACCEKSYLLDEPSQLPKRSGSIEEAVHHDDRFVAACGTSGQQHQHQHQHQHQRRRRQRRWASTGLHLRGDPQEPELLRFLSLLMSDCRPLRCFCKAHLFPEFDVTADVWFIGCFLGGVSDHIRFATTRHSFQKDPSYMAYFINKTLH